MTSANRFRDQLLNAEPISAERQQRFRDELAQIVEPALPRSHRLYYQFALVCLVIGIPGALCGLFLDAEHRLVWALNLLVFVPMAAWISHILLRGAEPLRSMQSMSKAFTGISTAAAFLLFSIGIQNPSVGSILWMLLGMLMFLLTSSINLWNRVISAERVTREHILRLEYRIADLASHLVPPGEGPDDRSAFLK